MRAQKTETEVRKEQIVQAAMELLGSQGLPCLTIDKIAAMVGIVPSTLYKHFKNKNQILKAIQKALGKRMLAIIKDAKLKGKTPLERLHQLFLSETRILIQNPGFPMMSLDTVSKHSPKSKEAIPFIKFAKTLHIEVTNFLKQAQQKGDIRTDYPAENFGYMYFAMVGQAIFVPILSGGEVDIIKHINIVWKAYLGMLQTK